MLLADLDHLGDRGWARVAVSNLASSSDERLLVFNIKVLICRHVRGRAVLDAVDQMRCPAGEAGLHAKTCLWTTKPISQTINSDHNVLCDF